MKPRTDTDSQQQLQRWKKKMMEKSGTFLAILALNLVTIILLGGMVIYHELIVPTYEPVTFKIKQAPPPPKPPAHGGNTAKSLEDPSVTVVPPSLSLPSIVTSTAPSSISFNVKAPTDITLSTSLPSLSLPSGSGMEQGSSGGGAPQTNPFGNSVDGGGSTGLVGYFYDLKQTSGDAPVPTGMTKRLWRIQMMQLAKDGLNEDDLSKYLKSPNPLSTHGFSIPQQASANAPAAFGLADKVKPDLWAAVYHVNVIVPAEGKYRFVGYGDDTIVVRANGKVVLDGGWQFLTKDESLHESYPNAWCGNSVDPLVRLRKGAWMDLTQGETLKMDVLIGDWGGLCGYFLMLEKDGVTYDRLPDGTPKLPLFQVGAKLPIPSGPLSPQCSASDDVWMPTE